LALAVSADIGSGIFFTHFLSKVLSYPVSWWGYVLGIFFALVPDFDVAIQKVRGSKVDSKHREITHYPMLVITMAFLVVGLLGLSSFWAALAALCLFAHFLHDSIGEANRWGVKWLAPFFPNSYQLFMRKSPDEPRRVICVWTPEELKRVKPLFLETWLRDYYLRVTGDSVASVVWLAASILIAYFW
jgi:membrane-bound metal-dependent hydrolase YbcI (DUF457 family)